jgi:Fur family ferric uptake transcriptional regulator
MTRRINEIDEECASTQEYATHPKRDHLAGKAMLPQLLQRSSMVIASKRSTSVDNMRRARALLAQSGGRVTAARSRVLAVLLAAGQVLSHQEVEQRLGKDSSVDRVTLYRVLEWLVASGLAHRVAGDDRAWRFGFAGHDMTHRHAHFSCNGCGQVFCLNDISMPDGVSLPPGFQSREIDLTIKGLCARCH